MEPIFITWWALKMTIGILPGLCLIAHSFECGYGSKPFRISGFIRLFRETKHAMNEAKKETAHIIFPWHPAIGLLLIVGILFIISGDSIMLYVINITAIAISFISYRQGVRLSGPIGVLTPDRDDPEFEMKLRQAYKAITPGFIMIMVPWLLLTAIIMTILYIFDLWAPH